MTGATPKRIRKGVSTIPDKHVCGQIADVFEYGALQCYRGTALRKLHRKQTFIQTDLVSGHDQQQNFVWTCIPLGALSQLVCSFSSC